MAKALGLLGAIDPARLSEVSKNQDEVKRIHLSNNSVGFICDLMNELARAFLSATDSNIQLSASFAMQELLRIHEIKAVKDFSKNITLTVGNQVWAMLPEHVRELLLPLYNSRYCLSGAKSVRPSIAHDAFWPPFYGTSNAQDFKKWLTDWMIQLLNLVEDEKDYEVFSVCKPIFKRDLNTALHLLPSVIMSILLHSPHHHSKVATEVLAVMSTGHTDSPSSSMDGVSQSYTPNRHMRQLCVETIFSVLDAIKVWVQRRWTEETSGRKVGKVGFQPSPQLQQMQDFLAVLPPQQLGKTAFKCHAFTRALWHIEEHVKNKPSALTQNLSFMQQIYVSLDESDGVAGITSIRENEPTLHDLIVHYKSQGRIQDAVGCYERLCFVNSNERTGNVLSEPSTSKGRLSVGRGKKFSPPKTNMLTDDPHIGLLQCYLNLDQPHAVLNITQGLIAKDNKYETHLNEFRMEAAWRLGMWDEMNAMLQPSDSLAMSSSSECVGRKFSSSSSNDGHNLNDGSLSNIETVPGSRNDCDTRLGMSWGECVGEALLCARRSNYEGYLGALSKLRRQIIPLLSAATMEKGAHQRAYPYLLKLHILSELEDMVIGVLKIDKVANAGIPCNQNFKFLLQPVRMSVDDLVGKWNDRLDLIQTSFRHLEPVLSFRRTLLLLASDMLGNECGELLQRELEKVWLHSAKVARKAKMQQQGEAAFLAAGNGREVFVERAKWSWLKGDKPQAAAILKRGLNIHFPERSSYKTDQSARTAADREACSRAQLLLAQYSEEPVTLDVNSMMLCYREASEINKDSEDGHFHFAMYLDRISSYRRENSVDYQYHIVVSLGKALACGNKHIYQSLPRMFSIWLEVGTLIANQGTASKKIPANRLPTIVEKLQQMNKLMGELCSTLQLYQLMTALPQLISRICHSHPGVFEQLSTIISTLLASYPQQTMWHMIAVSKSSYNMRVQRCIEILEAAKKKRSGLNKFINDITKLADRFIELANKQVQKNMSTNTVSVSNLVRSLPRLLAEEKFSAILVPTQLQMTVQLPPQHQRNVDTQGKQIVVKHNPFPSTEVYIQGIEDQAEVMASLQQPKKITLRASDGNNYIFMCKPKDDLRKDCRLMDFTRFVNRLLVRTPDARARNLLIRTYGVVPLNEECGLMEWVHNLNGLRNVVHSIYREKGIYMPASELKLYCCKQDTPINTKLDIFQNKLKSRHPPVLGEWFTRTFPHPHSWYHARMSYSRTTAVMSMVGYVLGLGDRHGENINLDSKTGDLVHVDFNCLFNKGETFDWPERVPFRLTHNMVNAMGPTGVEGPFRIACEITMGIMRDEREALMSVLKPFIHDPLVEWSRGDKGAKAVENSAKTTGEINNEKAQSHVRDIKHRLEGIIVSKARGFNIPLSVGGQVNCLIEDATNEKLLCQMYIGWAAYL